MASKMITTNLRIPENEWLQIRAIAAEKGMSANEYINNLLRTLSNKQQTAMKEPPISRKKMSIWDLPKIMQKAKRKPMGASQDDKIIYGH